MHGNTHPLSYAGGSDSRCRWASCSWAEWRSGDAIVVKLGEKDVFAFASVEWWAKLGLVTQLGLFSWLPRFLQPQCYCRKEESSCSIRIGKCVLVIMW